MSLRFIIIDDLAIHVSTTRGLLQRAGFLETDIWPADNHTVNRWEDALEQIIQLQHRGWNPKEICVVLVLDLALDEESLSFENAFRELERFASTALDPYVRIAYSHFSGVAQERGVTEFDAIISKQKVLALRHLVWVTSGK